MAVVPMKKVLICGLKKDRKQILELLQRQGAVEISNVLEEDSIFRKTDVSSSKTVFERNAAVAEQALSVLAEYAPEKKGLLAGFEGRETLSVEEYELIVKLDIMELQEVKMSKNKPCRRKTKSP